MLFKRLLIKWLQLDKYIIVQNELIDVKHYQEVLKDFSDTSYAKVFNQYLSVACNPERMLQINKEMGMKGFWYMKGYLKCGQDISKLINKTKENKNGK